MAANFQFIIRSGPNAGKVYPLEKPDISIGREANNDIAINDGEISRRHAKVTLHGTAYVIQDLGSTNGTFINGQRITGTQVLNPGDTVSFGENIVLLYEAAIDPNATIIASAQGPRTVLPIQKPAPASTPAVTPAPAPPPAQAPAYYNQVPANISPSTASSKRKKFPIWLIIVIVLLLVICACLTFFIIIDQLSLWCNVIPFLVPLLGGSCG